jgi:putative transposase
LGVVQWPHGYLNGPCYRGYRFPREILAYCVWLYFRFSLSFRDIQEVMLERAWKSHTRPSGFGAEVRSRVCETASASIGPFRGHLPSRQVFCKMSCRLVYLWRAVDQSGEVLDILMQKRRDAKAAKRLFRKMFNGRRYLRA